MKVLISWPALRERVADLMVDVDIEVVDWSQQSPQRGNDAFVCLPHPVPQWQLEWLRASAGVRAVQVLASGADHLRGFIPAGVPVFRAPQLRGQATAEVAVALTLSSLLRTEEWAQVRASEQWRWLQSSERLSTRRVVVLGRGSIGQAVARILDGFGCEVELFGRIADAQAIEELRRLIGAFHIVIVALPLTATTWHLFGRELLAALADGTLLVNVSRGAVIDTAALLAELSRGRLRAALDVFEEEPLPAGHALWTSRNVVLSPHVGGNVELDEGVCATFVAEQVTAVLSGQAAAHPTDPALYDW